MDAAAAVKAHVDQYIAHSEARSAPATVTRTLSDLHDVIDVIGCLFQRCINLFTASTWPILVPAIQHDWLAPLRLPWIDDDRRSVSAEVVDA